MKILITIAAILLACQISDAQTERGNQNLGASFGFSFTNGNNFTINPASGGSTNLSTTTNSFNIGPNYSYFIADKVDFGGALSFSTGSTTNSTANVATNNDSYPLKQTANNFSMTVFIRKYLMYEGKIGLRPGAYLGYTNGSQKNTYAASLSAYNFDSTTSYFSVGAGLDIVFYPSKKVGVSATLANLEYYHYNADNTTQGHDNGDNFSFNFVTNGLSVSVFYVFGGK